MRPFDLLERLFTAEDVGLSQRLREWMLRQKHPQVVVRPDQVVNGEDEAVSWQAPARKL